MRKLSYKQILVRLYESTDIQDLGFSEIMLTRKIKQFDKDIDGIYSIKLNKIVETVTDNIITLPTDSFNIDYILLGDMSDLNEYFLNSDEHYITINISEALDSGNELVYKLWSDISFAATQYSKLDFVISDGKIQIDPYYDGQTVTVFYSGYPKNKEGDFLVNETHVESLLTSLKQFLFEKQLFSRKMRGQRIYNDDNSFLRQLRSDKNLAMRNARVTDMKENEAYLKKDLVNIYNILIENDLYK